MIDYDLLNSLMGVSFALIIITMFVIIVYAIFKFTDYCMKENNKDRKALKKEIIDDIKKDLK